MLGREGVRVFLGRVCEELLPVGDSLVSGSGRGGPVALVLVLDTAARPVRIVGVQVPGDGGRFRRDVERNFPAEVRRGMRGGSEEQARRVEAMREANRAAARGSGGTVGAEEGDRPDKGCRGALSRWRCWPTRYQRGRGCGCVKGWRGGDEGGGWRYRRWVGRRCEPMSGLRVTSMSDRFGARFADPLKPGRPVHYWPNTHRSPILKCQIDALLHRAMLICSQGAVVCLSGSDRPDFDALLQ